MLLITGSTPLYQTDQPGHRVLYTALKGMAISKTGTAALTWLVGVMQGTSVPWSTGPTLQAQQVKAPVWDEGGEVKQVHRGIPSRGRHAVLQLPAPQAHAQLCGPLTGLLGLSMRQRRSNMLCRTTRRCRAQEMQAQEMPRQQLPGKAGHTDQGSFVDISQSRRPKW